MPETDSLTAAEMWEKRIAIEVKCDSCGRKHCMEPNVLARTHPDLTFGEMKKRARCQACGSKAITLTPDEPLVLPDISQGQRNWG